MVVRALSAWPTFVLRAATCVLAVATANATVRNIAVTLSGSQEVPLNASTGVASATVTVDDVTGAVTVAGSYSGLTSSAIAAHLHGAVIGINGPILMSLTMSGGTSGTIGGGGTLSPANLANLLAGSTYLNLHTTSSPGGELRGQIVFPRTFQSTLTGAEEVPPNAAPGIASASVSLNEATRVVTVEGTYAGLNSNATAAHIHQAAPGVNGPIVVSLTFSGGTTGTFNGTATLSAANVTNLLNGLTYLNVHTNVNPGGALRGQIVSPPAGWTSYCFGDGSLATPCPCVAPNTIPSPPSALAHGCANSLDLQGALLTGAGTTSPDTVRFTAGIAPAYSAFAFLAKGSASNGNGVASGDGVTCLGGALVRFGRHNAGSNGDLLGFWTYPNTAQTVSVSAATAQTPGQTAYYQLYYRNTTASFCNSGTTNWSNAISIAWP